MLTNTGALVSDADRGISLIEYDNMGWPRRVSFNAGHSIEYVYSIDGQRLRAIHNTAAEGVTVPVGMSADEVGAHIVRRDTTDYTGAVKWGAQGRAMRVEFPGGYAGFSDQSRPVFHFYTADHVGNNRVVVGADGTIEQIQHYYPFGTPIAGIGTNPDHQPYKHGGKELDRHYGLDWHDFAARQYHGPIAGWHNPDRLADNYPHLSPYTYCANNPLSFIDPSGMEICGWDEDDLNDFMTAFNYVFRDNRFDNFRNLIQQKKKSIQNIDDIAFNSVVKSGNFTDDDIALMNILVGAINDNCEHIVISGDRHKVINDFQFMKMYADTHYEPGSMTPLDIKSLDRVGGVYVGEIARKFGGETFGNKKKTYSIFGSSNQNITETYINSYFHEVLGHGVLLGKGIKNKSVHNETAVQLENLVRRVSGDPNVYDGYTGIPHMDSKKPHRNPTAIPTKLF